MSNEQQGQGAASGADTPVIGKVRARDFIFECPHCGAAQEGWAIDPRGRSDECDACGCRYRVAREAAVGFR